MILPIEFTIWLQGTFKVRVRVNPNLTPQPLTPNPNLTLTLTLTTTGAGGARRPLEEGRGGARQGRAAAGPRLTLEP